MDACVEAIADELVELYGANAAYAEALARADATYLSGDGEGSELFVSVARFINLRARAQKLATVPRPAAQSA